MALVLHFAVIIANTTLSTVSSCSKTPINNLISLWCNRDRSPRMMKSRLFIGVLPPWAYSERGFISQISSYAAMLLHCSRLCVSVRAVYSSSISHWITSCSSSDAVDSFCWWLATVGRRSWTAKISRWPRYATTSAITPTSTTATTTNGLTNWFTHCLSRACYRWTKRLMKFRLKDLRTQMQTFVLSYSSQAE